MAKVVHDDDHLHFRLGSLLFPASLTLEATTEWAADKSVCTFEEFPDFKYSLHGPIALKAKLL